MPSQKYKIYNKYGLLQLAKKHDLFLYLKNRSELNRNYTNKEHVQCIHVIEL
jgi:hypothetical protein